MKGRFQFYAVGRRGQTFTKLSNAKKAAKRLGGTVEIFGHRAGADISNLTLVTTVRNPMATKKKKKKAKRSTAKNRTKKCSTAKNKKQKRSTAKHHSKSNPGAKLRQKIAQMKPGSWYPTTLSGARVKVQRKGNSLVIRPATKKRSR